MLDRAGLVVRLVGDLAGRRAPQAGPVGYRESALGKQRADLPDCTADGGGPHLVDHCQCLVGQPVRRWTRVANSRSMKTSSYFGPARAADGERSAAARAV